MSTPNTSHTPGWNSRFEERSPASASGLKHHRRYNSIQHLFPWQDISVTVTAGGWQRCPDEIPGSQKMIPYQRIADLL
jgi:hypothetical protein